MDHLAADHAQVQVQDQSRFVDRVEALQDQDLAGNWHIPADRKNDARQDEAEANSERSMKVLSSLER